MFPQFNEISELGSIPGSCTETRVNAIPGNPETLGRWGSVGGSAAAAIVASQQGNKWSWLHLDRGSMGAQCNRPALRALNRSSSRWSGWATAMRRWARSLRLAPRSSATPYSVTTWSTVFLSVVTTLPGVRASISIYIVLAAIITIGCVAALPDRSRVDIEDAAVYRGASDPGS